MPHDTPRSLDDDGAGTLLAQASTAPVDDDRHVDPELAACARAVAAQGAVLLRNDDALPLEQGASVAVFGRVQLDWFAVGYGSGGDVNAPYSTNLLDSLRDGGEARVDAEVAAAYTSWCSENPADSGEVWGHWPRFHPEMPLADGFVETAAERNGTAVVVIGRAAGEDRENVLEEGSFLLTALERDLLERVTGAFAKTVVVIDAGNVIDLAWVDEYPIDAVLLAWLGGMEGARAIADVLVGAVEPGGRLTDSIARTYEDYPSAGHFGDPGMDEYVEDVYVGYRYLETFTPRAVLFPFGFGLGYTGFALDGAVVDLGEDVDTVRVRVTNTGDRPGSEVVQLYVDAPEGALGTPYRALVGFARTPEIEPGESADVVLEVPIDRLTSYDDAGATGHRSAWVLQEGRYRYLLGTDVRSAEEVGARDVPRLLVRRQLEEAAAVRPEHVFDRVVLRRDDDGRAQVELAPVPVATVDLAERILDRLPEQVGERAVSTSSRLTIDAVDRGEMTLDAFVTSLTPQDLADLTYGDVVMDSSLGAPGNAGALGGVTEALRDRGVPAAATTDGPSGIRVSSHASLLPCGTALASTWDVEAVRALAAVHAEEMIRKGSDVLLAPGMNIHRNPLGGRNFEYFSEDPLLTGAMASAVVSGIQSRGVAACPKHFAANSQETDRVHHDARVSERALREVYLRGFEICVREARPRTLMTSYNKVNGIWAHYHHDLVTTILRGEWGYEGLVMTDWWMQPAQDPEFPALRDSAYRVRAQVDVLMPGSSVHFGTTRDGAVLEALGVEGGLTLGELQRSARTVLRYLLDAGLVRRGVRGRRAGGAAGADGDAGEPA